MSTAFRPADRRNSLPSVVPLPTSITPLPRRSSTVRRATPASQTAVSRLPAPDAPPKWVRSLIKLQQASLITTFTLAGLVLVTYGWTVYAQQLWGKEYQKLADLRRNERQIGASSAMLQNHLANQASSPNTTLVPRTPASMIFLKPAPTRTTPTPPPASKASPVAPLGY